MSNKKLVNEKTFELNITSELLDLSKSFIWYLEDSPISHYFPTFYWKNFLKQNILYATGLTQDEESSAGGGYDVAIHIKRINPNYDNRILFLQYKAGVNMTRCNNPDSHFHSSKKHVRDTNHVLFTFNDAAHKTQHGILRRLAKNPSIPENSVLYVFPRITNKEDFNSKIGSLLKYSSFIPVTELDTQAKAQSPTVIINDGTKHKFRTSYDGKDSEVNFSFFYFINNHSTFFAFVAELICVQIERFTRLLLNKDFPINANFVGLVREAVKKSIEDYFDESEKYAALIVIYSKVINYLEKFTGINSIKEIPIAPQKFTKTFTQDELRFNLEAKQIDTIEYQIF